jgi:predicted ATPase
MLTRLYVNNFRCLVNFELKLGRLNLLVGENGSGKTSVFDVLHRLRLFLSGDSKVDVAFPSRDLTRWQTAGMQRFEIELALGSDSYVYLLLIEHDTDRRIMRVKEERLTLGGRSLFEFKDGNARLFRDNFSVGPEYPFDWTQSGVASLHERPDNRKLTRFRKELARLVVAQANPAAMSSESRREERTLSRSMDNFASWYRYLSQERQEALPELFAELSKVLPGFAAFSIKEAGEDVRVLKVLFDREPPNGRPLVYDFGELSDGQRVLVALYSLLFGLKGVKDEGALLFLDEPENYVTLREIQPWLTTLTELCGEGVEQAVLISHHPEVIDYLAGSAGIWFERDGGGPARVTCEPPSLPDGLKVSEAMARGWTR